MRSAIVFLALCSLSGGVVAAEPPPTPISAATPNTPPLTTASQVFAALATLEGLEADFVETKTLALLAAPLTSKGTLYFERPGRLARHVTEPSSSQVVITPTRLQMTDASGKVERIELGARPDVKLFVESFVKVLAGDERALSSLYAITFKPAGAFKPAAGKATSAAAQWQMTLTPRPSPSKPSRGISAFIAKLIIVGRGPSVDRIDVVETSGDTTATTITRADSTRRFSPAERAALFHVAVGSP